MSRAMGYVYGPVPSRRLGRSLGIDLVPFKTCTYDCIYCQLGRTTDKTIARYVYAPVHAILDELEIRLPQIPLPDFIALAGSGEPTLHAGIGLLIRGIKKITHIPVAVLTNGSLLWMPDVRESIAESDLVLPSLDAGSPRRFTEVNRPHSDISFDTMVEGLVAFSEICRGKIWMEVFVLGGITDSSREMKKIVSIVNCIQPARVQLNTVSRPPAENIALSVADETMERLRTLFPGTCEVIADCAPSALTRAAISRNALEAVSILLARRPCTVRDIASGLLLPPNEVLQHLDILCENGVVRPERRGDVVFYVLR